MKKHLLISVMFALIGLGVFSFGKDAKAYDVIVDTTSNAQLSNGYSYEVSSTILANQDGVSTIIPGTNTDIIKDLRLWVYVDPTFRSNHPTSTIEGEISSVSGTIFSASQSISAVPTLGGYIDFDFSANTTISASTGIFAVGVLQSPDLSSSDVSLGYSSTLGISGNAGNQTPVISSCHDYLTTANCSQYEGLWAMYGAGGEPPIGNVLNVQFQNPPFLPGRTGPDFRNWQICNTIPSAAGISGYYDTITYGTSTPYGVATDSLLTTVGIIPLTAPLINSCPVITKNATSSPGNYEAEITLYKQDGTVLATSTVLNFTIVGGNLTDYIPLPIFGTSTPPVICGTTGFQVFGADIGQGLCNTAQYLFVPQSLTAWTDTQAIVQTRAPFSYLYEIGNDFTNLATSSSATISPLTLTIGSTGTPINFSVDMFSANTIDKYTNSTIRGVLRTLIQWSLYLAFISMVIFEVRKLFSKQKQ